MIRFQMVQKHTHCPTKNDILFHVYFVQMLSLSGRAPRDVPINPALCVSCAPDSWKALHSLWKSNTIPCESPTPGCRGLSTTEPRTGLSWNLPQSFWAIKIQMLQKVLPRKKHYRWTTRQERITLNQPTWMVIQIPRTLIHQFLILWPSWIFFFIHTTHNTLRNDKLDKIWDFWLKVSLCYPNLSLSLNLSSAWFSNKALSLNLTFTFSSSDF